jgi:hypothetical protein
MSKLDKKAVEKAYNDALGCVAFYSLFRMNAIDRARRIRTQQKEREDWLATNPHLSPGDVPESDEPEYPVSRAIRGADDRTQLLFTPAEQFRDDVQHLNDYRNAVPSDRAFTDAAVVSTTFEHAGEYGATGHQVAVGLADKAIREIAAAAEDHFAHHVPGPRVLDAAGGRISLNLSAVADADIPGIWAKAAPRLAALPPAEFDVVMKRLQFERAQLVRAIRGNDPQPKVQPSADKNTSTDVDWESHAIALLFKDPSLSLPEVAEAVGKNKTSLYRSDRVMEVATRMGRYKPRGSGPRRTVRGHKAADGTVEAFVDDE